MTVTPNPRHPAKFSQPILDVLDRLVRAEQRRLARPITVLDPFCGVGRIHTLAREDRIETTGIEIEPEWAACHQRTICADSLAWMRQTTRRFDVIATSVTYGNRFADSHDAKDGSTRHSYTHDLGHALTEGNSGSIPWGRRYWTFHAEAYRIMLGVLRPPDGPADLGGVCLLNVSDFVKDKALVPATSWHRGAMWGAGFVEAEGERPRLVETSRMTYGANTDRAPGEIIYRFRRPS